MIGRIWWVAAMVLLWGVTAPSIAADPVRLPPVTVQGGEPWQPGLHYTVLVPGEAPELAPGKVQLVELFMYTSGISMRLQPYLQAWLKAHPEVEYVRQPSIVFPHAREQARLYFTLKALGREDLHDKFFEYVRDEDRYPVYHTIRHPAKEAMLDMNLAFARDNGIDPKQFTDTYLSREIDSQVIAAEIDTHGYHVNGTSTLVVNGRYSTSVQRLMYLQPDPGKDTPEDYARLLKLLDHLVAAERAAQ